MPTVVAKPGRWWRFPLYLLLALLMLFGLLLMVLRTSFAREQLRTRLNVVLAEVLQGKIVIERIGALTPWGVGGVDARIFDPGGKQVIRAQGLSCTAWLPGLARQFLFNSERPEIALLDVHVDYADVVLREDEELGVTLAQTFLPRPSTEPPQAPTAPDAGPRLAIASIRFERIWAHGRVQGSPALDGDLLQLHASLRQAPLDGVELSVHRAELVTRALPLGLDPAGRLSFDLAVPADDRGPLRLEGTLDGQAAGSPLSAEISWVGDRLHGGVELRRLPASFVNARAPGLALDGDVTLRADVDGELPELDFEVEADAPAAHLKANGYGFVTDGFEAGAELQVARVDLSRVLEGGPASALDASVQVALFERDAGHLDGAARLQLAPGRLAAQATPALLATGAAALDDERGFDAHGRLLAEESGALLHGNYELRFPRGRAGLIAVSSNVRLQDPPRLAQLGLRAAGTASVQAELQPETGALSGKASLSLSHLEQPFLQARNVELRSTAAGTLQAPRVHAAATLDLLSGRAHADLDYSPAGQTLDVFVAEVDLLRLSHELGLRVPLERGSFDLDAHVTRAAREQRYTVNAHATTDLGKLGSVSLDAKELKLPSSFDRVKSLATAEGTVNAQGKLDLRALSPLLVRAGLPIEQSVGRVSFEASARRSRESSERFELAAQVDTHGLRIVQKRATPSELATTSDAIASQPRALEGIDVHATLHAWPERGELVATAILRDPRGTLLEAQAATQLEPLLGHGVPDGAALAELPLQVSLEMPERRLQSLPALIRPAALRGRMALQAKLDGSLQEPRVELALEGKSLRASGSKAPIDVIAQGSYAPAGGKLQALGRSTRLGTEVGSAAVRWQGDLRQAPATPGRAHGLVASADVKLEDFPLDVVPALVDRQLGGRVSGALSLSDWGRDAHIDAELSSNSLVLGKVPVEQLAATARSDARQLQASLELHARGGSSRARLEADVSWGARALPQLGHRGLAELETHSFRLETLSPLFGAYVSELGGVLDARTRVVVTPGNTELSGNARLEKGVVQVPSIGQRFSDISAQVDVADDQFKLEHLEARGTTGRVSVRGAAHLDGFDLRGAEAHLAIQKHEALPLTLEGAVLGDAWGKVDARYDSPKQGERKLNIDVPSFHLLAPESTAHGLQSLDEAESIRVGVRRADGKFVQLPLQPLDPGGTTSSLSGEPPQPLRVTIQLGNDVSVERGRSAQAQLTGRLTILSAQQTEVDGRIEVKGGKLDVSGKTFEIERGVVTFSGDDPSNPTITATARWDAPEYAVYAEYLGDVKNGRIKLHTEPPLTQDEIASLLLFGSPEGSVGGGNSSAAGLAVSVAGDSAVKGLNQVLDDFTNLDVSARVDTTTGSARPELVFQVSPRVAAKVTRAIGTPAAGESPDRTFLTLELRLKRAWALSAVFGDHGASALDLIWRRRY